MVSQVLLSDTDTDCERGTVSPSTFFILGVDVLSCILKLAYERDLFKNRPLESGDLMSALR